LRIALFSQNSSFLDKCSKNSNGSGTADFPISPSVFYYFRVLPWSPKHNWNDKSFFAGVKLVSSDITAHRSNSLFLINSRIACSSRRSNGCFVNNKRARNKCNYAACMTAASRREKLTQWQTFIALKSARSNTRVPSRKSTRDELKSPRIKHLQGRLAAVNVPAASGINT